MIRHNNQRLIRFQGFAFVSIFRLSIQLVKALTLKHELENKQPCVYKCMLKFMQNAAKAFFYNYAPLYTGKTYIILHQIKGETLDVTNTLAPLNI